jgi:hypothetical protein
MWMQSEMRRKWILQVGKWFQVVKECHDVTPRRVLVAWRWRRTISTRPARVGY